MKFLSICVSVKMFMGRILPHVTFFVKVDKFHEI